MNLAQVSLPFVKRLPPELAHALTLSGLKSGLAGPRQDPSRWQTSITLKKSGLKLFNPVGLAAGFDKNAEVGAVLTKMGFGFVECGTVTPKPQSGNPKPRVFRLPQERAVINRLGFNNKGLSTVAENLKSQTQRANGPIGANVGANKDSADFVADYELGLQSVLPIVDYVTMNISSPNTPGLRDLHARDALKDLLSRTEAVWSASKAQKPVFLKLAPDLDGDAITAITDELAASGTWLAGLIISNTTVSRPHGLRGGFAQEAGGLSGRPLAALSLEMLQHFAAEFSDTFDLIACGGVDSGEAAYQRIRAGAQAIQLYTALTYRGLDLIADINSDLRLRLSRDGFQTVADAVGVDLPSSR